MPTSTRARLYSIAKQLNELPHASKIYLFGSLVSDKANPNDVDCFLDAREYASWEDTLKAYRQTIAGMRRIAYVHYGSVDPFVRTQSQLIVRNDEATGWKVAANARALTHAMEKQAVPLHKWCMAHASEWGPPPVSAAASVPVVYESLGMG